LDGLQLKSQVIFNERPLVGCLLSISLNNLLLLVCLLSNTLMKSK